MCNGSGAGGSSPKALMATTDAGRSWRTIAVVPSILAALKPGSLPWQEVLTIVAASASRLWLATANEMAQSTDSGVTWARVRAVNPQGAAASFDVLSPRRAWVLASGAGLWGTSNGTQCTASEPRGPAWPDRAQRSARPALLCAASRPTFEGATQAPND
jgi:photosystem II stability/assembly factor-like uncharacterized protein